MMELAAGSCRLCLSLIPPDLWLAQKADMSAAKVMPELFAAAGANPGGPFLDAVGGMALVGGSFEFNAHGELAQGEFGGRPRRRGSTGKDDNTGRRSARCAV